ncbi:SOS response-associated peptidase [Aliiglaciecola sp. LCG003]|uniref:SOS response-associated peptidase n=1 Tax=Aliiglaciecola sp. LCG003 TaxID=3053655 RepID=UPI0025728C09|nr:SOS response-associated peptidase [Aliiglaciecola sp. LCG003]WJG09764.1 SOS response-associated peptidase [Aliiglaciecola sp. LCG003]
MCGRYANHIGAMLGWTDVLADWPAQAELSFNIAPSQMAPIVTSQGCAVFRWGLLPAWVDTQQTAFSTFNARLATLAEKPSFRDAWTRGRRCIVPALGYYEWQQQSNTKQAYFVTRKDCNPILFGGLFECPRLDTPGSFTIITRPAEGLLEPLHHAMPLMFEASQAKLWMHGNVDESENLAWQPYSEDYRFYPVSNRVNNVHNQGTDLIREILPEVPPQQGFGF